MSTVSTTSGPVIAMLAVGRPPAAADACVAAVTKRGAEVKWIDPAAAPDDWKDVDAVIIPPGVETAGDTVAPTLAVIKQAVTQGMPVRGIAAGHLLLNAAAGGTYGPLDPEADGSMPVDHQQPHWVLTLQGSRVSKIMGEHMRAPSQHAEAVQTLAPGFMVVMRTADNTIEAIEKMSNTNVIGIQFDPAAVEGGGSYRFFETLVDDANVYYRKTHAPAFTPTAPPEVSEPTSAGVSTQAATTKPAPSYSNLPLNQRRMTREEQDEFDRKNAEMAQAFQEANYF